LKKNAGTAAEGEVVSAGEEALLDCVGGALDFADVAIVGSKVQVYGEIKGSDARELGDGVYVANSEAARGVTTEDGTELGEDGLEMKDGDVGHDTETDTVGDGVKKDVPVYEEKIITV
jgi:hypothetical protein